MNKNIGFRRNIFLSWLDAAGAICVEECNASRVRTRLDPIIEQQIASKENRRMALDILLNIWVKTGERHPDLREAAVAHYAEAETPGARVCLHYGLRGCLRRVWIVQGEGHESEVRSWPDVPIPAM